jgi:hypothetical protein
MSIFKQKKYTFSSYFLKFFLSMVLLVVLIAPTFVRADPSCDNFDDPSCFTDNSTTPPATTTNTNTTPAPTQNNGSSSGTGGAGAANIPTSSSGTGGAGAANVPSSGMNTAVTGVSINTKIANPLGPNITDIPTFINVIVSFVLLIGIPIIVLAVIYAGFLFVTAQGNSEKLKKAKTTLLYTLIGAALLLGSFVIAKAIQGTVNQITS